MKESIFIRNHLREINESVSCLWDGIIPIYSESTETLRLVYDKTDSSLKMLINEVFWEGINNYDRCFLIMHCLLKIIFSHKSRSGFLSDKMCAAIASNITINEKILITQKMIFSEMSILPKLYFIKNTIPNNYIEYINSDYTMEFIFTLLLHISSNKIATSSKFIIDYDSSDFKLKKTKEDETQSQESTTPYKHDLNLDYDEIIDSDEFPAHELNSQNQKNANKDKTNSNITTPENKNYIDSGQKIMDKISDLISDGISKRMIDKDFPIIDGVDNEYDYLSLATDSVSSLVNINLNSKGLNKIDMLSSRMIGDLAKSKYKIKIEHSKKLKLKKILQKKMLRSDDLDDDEQFIYRDEFLYGMSDDIRIPSIKNIGENKKNKKHIILYIDSSGSCKMFSEKFAQKVISLKFSDVKLRVFSFDDTVSEVKLKGKSIGIKTTFQGTSFSSVVKHSNELISSGDIDKHSLFLVLTDGIDHSFKDKEKNEIRSKKQWYWFLTNPPHKTNVDSNCGNIMRLSEFL